MDIDLIKAYCELAKQGNYKLAANNLFITQSALTKKIQRLEEVIGAQLFYRRRNGSSLTPIGVTLLPEAKRLLSGFNTFEDLSQQVVDGKAGLLKVGFGISSYFLATDAIASFTKMHPDVHVSLDDIPSHKQIDMLRTGELDVSFRRLPVSGELEARKLISDELTLAVHKSISVDPTHPLDSVLGKSFMRLNPSRGPGVDHMVNKYLVDTGRSLPIERSANDILTLVTMISANLGFSILPRSTSYLSNEQVQFIPLTDSDTRWDVGVVWDPTIENPARDRFLNHLSY